jgi:cyclomaltodextrinase
MQKKYILIGLLLAAIGWTSCQKSIQKSEAELVPRLVMPITLNPDVTVINLLDFLSDSTVVDSVFIGNRKMDFYQNHHTISYIPLPEEQIPPLQIMTVFAQNKKADVLLKKSEEMLHLYLFDPQGKEYQSVQLKGEFNGWTPSEDELKFQEGKWGKMLHLNRGKYQYLLMVDGVQMLDPGNPDSISNGSGGYNSVLKVGLNEQAKPQMWTESTQEKDIIISCTQKQDAIYALINNTLLDRKYINATPGQIRISIPENCTGNKIMRVFAYNDNGTFNDLLIPIKDGKADTEVKAYTSHQDKIMYNVFVDRFFDGDTNNNFRLPDSIVLPPANYHGGDVAGIQHIIEQGYFDDLSINTLWLSPIVKNTEGAYGFWPEPKTKFSAYHGYWPVSFTQIDRHFGDEASFKSLVDAAHAKNYKVLVDYVANHVHELHPYFVANPESATPLQLPDGRLNLELWDEQRLTTWFDTFLPTLDLEKEEIAEMLADSILWWAQNYELDGFRYDAAKHVPLSFWQKLTDKLSDNNEKAQTGELYQLGETYGSAALISSYLSTGMLDAQFDFNLYDAAIGAFARGENLQNLLDRLQESLRYYGNHHVMGNITGNQDRGRFISYAGGSLKFDEDPKKAGWTRKIEVGDSSAYHKILLLMAFNMTIPGIPVIYYGDEFGMPGGNDPDCRRMMRFGEQLSQKEKSNLAITQKLAQLRKENPALRYGDFCLMEASEHVLILARKYFGNIVILALNNSNQNQSYTVDVSTFAHGINLEARIGEGIELKDDQVKLNISPYSFTIISNR